MPDDEKKQDNNTSPVPVLSDTQMTQIIQSVLTSLQGQETAVSGSTGQIEQLLERTTSLTQSVAAQQQQLVRSQAEVEVAKVLDDLGGKISPAQRSGGLSELLVQTKMKPRTVTLADGKSTTDHALFVDLLAKLPDAGPVGKEPPGTDQSTGTDGDQPNVLSQLGFSKDQLKAFAEDGGSEIDLDFKWLQ